MIGELDAQNIHDFINLVEGLLVRVLIFVVFCQAAVAVIGAHRRPKGPPTPKPQRKKVVKGARGKRGSSPQKDQ